MGSLFSKITWSRKTHFASITLRESSSKCRQLHLHLFHKFIYNHILVLLFISARIFGNSDKMLRRPPTAITLTQDDIARYEEARQQRLEAQQMTQQSNVFSESSTTSIRDINGPADRQKNRTTEQRILGR